MMDGLTHVCDSRVTFVTKLTYDKYWFSWKSKKDSKNHEENFDGNNPLIFSTKHCNLILFTVSIIAIFLLYSPAWFGEPVANEDEIPSKKQEESHGLNIEIPPALHPFQW